MIEPLFYKVVLMVVSLLFIYIPNTVGCINVRKHLINLALLALMFIQ